MQQKVPSDKGYYANKSVIRCVRVIIVFRVNRVVRVIGLVQGSSSGRLTNYLLNAIKVI